MLAEAGSSDSKGDIKVRVSCKLYIPQWVPAEPIFRPGLPSKNLVRQVYAVLACRRVETLVNVVSTRGKGGEGSCIEKSAHIIKMTCPVLPASYVWPPHTIIVQLGPVILTKFQNFDVWHKILKGL